MVMLTSTPARGKTKTTRSTLIPEACCRAFGIDLGLAGAVVGGVLPNQRRRDIVGLVVDHDEQCTFAIKEVDPTHGEATVALDRERHLTPVDPDASAPWTASLATHRRARSQISPARSSRPASALTASTISSRSSAGLVVLTTSKLRPNVPWFESPFFEQELERSDLDERSRSAPWRSPSARASEPTVSARATSPAQPVQSATPRVR